MDPSNIEESKSATVHGVLVGGVSPIKSSRKNADRKYFEMKLSDGDKTVRVVLFEPKLKKEVDEAYKNRLEVSIANCSIKRGIGDSLEILANSKSQIV